MPENHLPEPGPPGGFDQALGDARFTTVFSRMHPLSPLRPAMKKQGLNTAEDLLDLPHGSRVRVAGMTITVNTPITRDGRRVMFVTMEDETGLIDLAVFGNLQVRSAKTIMTSTLLGVEGILHRAGPEGRALSVNAHKILGSWTGSLIKILEREKRVSA